MIELQKLLAGHIKMDLREGLRIVQQEYLKYVVTTVQDGASSTDAVQFMKKACDEGAFVLDVVSYPVMSEADPGQFFIEYPECDQKYNNHFKLGGYKTVLDGSPQGKSAWLTKPYDNSGGC